MLEYYESEAIPTEAGDIARSKPMVYRRHRIMVHKDQVNHGVEAVFIPINAVEGLKLYITIKDGKLARQCQKEAHGFDLGPEVLSPLLEFVFPLGSEEYVPVIARRFFDGKAYGYYTQLADTDRVPIGLMDCMLDSLKDECMEKLSFKISDVHDRNVGYIGDKLVLIDFGYNSTGEPTQRPRGHFSLEVDDGEITNRSQISSEIRAVKKRSMHRDTNTGGAIKRPGMFRPFNKTRFRFFI